MDIETCYIYKQYVDTCYDNTHYFLNIVTNFLVPVYAVIYIITHINLVNIYMHIKPIIFIHTIFLHKYSNQVYLYTIFRNLLLSFILVT